MIQGLIGITLVVVCFMLRRKLAKKRWAKRKAERKQEFNQKGFRIINGGIR